MLEPFIKRPVGTTLLTIGLILAGILAFNLLPVSPLPQVDYPTISVSASLPGADPQTMATSVAAPLERQFGKIAGLMEMTSVSYRGAVSITLQFDLKRDINGAARDVQAAINAARSYLPFNMPTQPTYRKVNPSDAPILILALTSNTISKAQMYDAASTILQQRLSQVNGVGQVLVGGGAMPAIRVELNPFVLNQYGISLAQVRGLLANTNLNWPKGMLNSAQSSWEVYANDQLQGPWEYEELILSYHAGRAVKLKDVARVEDSVEDLRVSGIVNGKPAIMVIIFRQPGADILRTVDNIRSILPQLEAALPRDITLSVVLDRTPPIRASLQEVKHSLVLSGLLVVLVVFWFLRDVRATLIPAVSVLASIVATFGVMYLLGYSLNNLSLMALTIATGFVVDDAIVVLENIIRYREMGHTRLQAAILGSQEIAFTVISISLSLVAVFIPILLMEGMVGRLFKEFAVTLSTAVLLSMLISLTTTPMMCAHLLREQNSTHGKIYQFSQAIFHKIQNLYQITLHWALSHSVSMLLMTAAGLAASILLFIWIPKGFFPEQDTGRITGTIQASQDISFLEMQNKLKEISQIIQEDPDVSYVAAFIGGGHGSSINTARMFITLVPFEKRKATARDIIARLRKKLAHIPGAPTFLQPVQDLRIGGRISGSLYQYTLQAEDFTELNTWAQKVLQAMRSIPILTDVNSDLQNRGLEAQLKIQRATASRLGVDMKQVDETLYDAFGQRQVSILYKPLNQYHVVMEVTPELSQHPDTLKNLYVPNSLKRLIPLAAFSSWQMETGPLTVSHQGQFPAVTISFNLAPAPESSLGEAVKAIEEATQRLGMPFHIQGRFAGTAKAFQTSLQTQPFLILAALAAVYIVLGILYESYLHPITILSTLPSAGVGALLALMAFGLELNLIAMIGILLLIGIVKKNGIILVDFALNAQRVHKQPPQEAIYQAAILRFRPIMMTTMAALFGALPLALAGGAGSELRRPLGIAIVGGLILSQMLTLYTTPVVYLYLDRLRLWFQDSGPKTKR